METTTERLQEFVAVKGSRIDREAGVLRGVRILGLKSSSGRTYTLDCVTAARSKYEGVRVHIEHGNSPNGQRKYADRIGVLKNITVDGGLKGDLYINTKHALAEQLMFNAENDPQNVGLSHVADCRLTRGPRGEKIVEEIVRVYAVDIVPDGATAPAGLFEAVDPDAEKQRMASAVAKEIGLPACCVEHLEGLRYRDTPQEIRECLANLKATLVENGSLDAEPPKLARGDRLSADDLRGRIIGLGDLEERREFASAFDLPEPGRNGHSFFNEIS